MADNNNQQKQIIISIGADTSSIKQEIESVKQEMGDIGKTPIKADSVKSLKQQLKEAKEEAIQLQQAGKMNTESYRNAVTTISTLKDEMDVLARNVQSFDPGNKFQAFGQIAGNAATTVAGLAGALSIVGVDAENAAEVMAKLQGLMLMTTAIDSVGDLTDFWKAFKLRITEATASQTALNTTQMVGVGITKALKIGLASLGIGLVVTAISYLIANFDSIKNSVMKLLPSMGSMGKSFDKIKSIAVGVGNVVIKWIIQPIKTLIYLLQGEWKQAVQAYADGLNVMKNFKDGYDGQEKRNTENRYKEQLEGSIKQQEKQLEILKAGGKSTLAAERKILRDKARLYADDAEKLAEVTHESLVFEAGVRKDAADKAKAAADKAAQARKAAADKAKQERESQLKEISDNEAEVENRIRQFSMSSREKDLDDLEKSFEKKKALYKKFGKSTLQLEEDYYNQRREIDEKYDKGISDFIESVGSERLSQYDKLIEETNKKYDDISKNAIDNQKETLESLRIEAIREIEAIKELDATNTRSQINLTTTESQNTLVTGETPDSAYNKTMNVLAAQRQAETDSYALELQKIGDNQLAKEKLEAEHQARLKSIKDGEAAAAVARTTAQKELDKAEMESKLNQLDTVGNALGNFAQLAGESTASGKALAIAQGTISAITGAIQSFTSMSSIPIVGPALGAVAAAGALAAGYANVKKILAVKVPTKSGSGGTISAPALGSMSAPNISANPQSLLPQDVRVTNSSDTIVQAVISDKELTDNSNRNNFLNNLNSL